LIAQDDAAKVESRLARGPQISIGSATAKGTRRLVNEDHFCIDPAGRYLLVADGMGGLAAGEVASELACRMVSRRIDELLGQSSRIDWRTVLPRVLSRVNDALLTLTDLDRSQTTMGTTIVAAVFDGWRVCIAWLGDSRCHLVQPGRATQLTVDHTLAQALATAGLIDSAAVARHPWRHALSRYLGCADRDNRADVIVAECLPGDCLLLATDGITDRLSLEELAEAINDSGDPQQSARELVEMSVARGSTDDVTCVLARLEGTPCQCDAVDGFEMEDASGIVACAKPR
jgi:protein phosphatase